MTHLCYVYIKEYEGRIKDTELVIDCHYNYKYDKEKRTLKISENKDFPNKFWGENVYSITGLVGNNGAGKTTVIRSLLDLLVEGYANAHVNCIAVYKNEDFFVYGGNGIKITFKSSIIKQNDNDSSRRIPCFYHSGHFSPFINNSSTEMQVNGLYNASDNMRIIEDLQNYYNKNSYQMNFPFLTYLRSHVAQNNYRICMMLANKQLSDIIHEYTTDKTDKDEDYNILPKYVIIKANQSGAESIRHDKSQPNNKYKNITIPLFKNIYDHTSPFNHILSFLIYNNLINLLYDRYETFANNDDSDYNIVDKWQEKINRDSPILDQFKTFIDGFDPLEKEVLEPIYDVLKELNYLTDCTFMNSPEPYLYIDCEKDKDKLTILGEKIIKKNIFLTSKFFDIHYAKCLYYETRLSSGELELLNLFSRIYDALYLNKNKKAPHIIILDEAEIGFHPNWQRKYLNLVIEFLDKLKEIDPNLADFQIIISTHSPILLSDIPKCCTNYLKQGPGKKTINVSKEEIGETFAANVFDLYRMSFFMENGLVGEFSRKKIKELNSKISKGGKRGIINEIKMIGDERIQEYLMDKYQKRHPKDELLKEEIINYYKGRINLLTTTNKKKGKIDE